MRNPVAVAPEVWLQCRKSCNSLKFRVCSAGLSSETAIINRKLNNYFQYNLNRRYSTGNLWLPLLLRSLQQQLNRMVWVGGEDISWNVTSEVWGDQPIKVSSQDPGAVSILGASYHVTVIVLIWIKTRPSQNKFMNYHTNQTVFSINWSLAKIL